MPLGLYILSGTRCGFQIPGVRCMVPYPHGSHQVEPKANVGPGSDRPMVIRVWLSIEQSNVFSTLLLDIEFGQRILMASYSSREPGCSLIVRLS